MENDIRKVSNHVEQYNNAKEDECAQYDKFINALVRIVEKYGESILQDLDCVA